VGPPARASPGTAYREALPDCESFRSFRFEPLPETIGEIDEITKSWGRTEEVVVLKGPSAGERSVKELLPGKRVAHFATHGFFLDGNCAGSGEADDAGKRGIGGISPLGAPHPAPRVGVNPFLLAGLALAGANRRANVGPSEEDGILTAEEIASLDLSGVDWVVLSACDTGVGEVRSGEGVLGLRRAFEVAGAGTLIMSLWAVEDRSARDWMSTLYDGRFRRNLDTAEAVREANLGVLKSLRAQGRSTHPFYWAAFVAAGGWR
jgi:CHAT domain-containing protein